jgi:Siderophore-interacting FAD-binding domain
MSGLGRFPRRSGIARLAERRQLTPRMIRVTLACEGFRDGWPIQQPGDIITLLFVPPGEEIVLPLTGWRFPDGAPEQEWRNYTVRRHDREAGEIEVDVVLHEPRGRHARGRSGRRSPRTSATPGPASTSNPGTTRSGSSCAATRRHCPRSRPSSSRPRR